MLKNIFGKVLLSLVMDKKARSNLSSAGGTKQKESIAAGTKSIQAPKAPRQKLDESEAKLSEASQLQEALQRLEKALNGSVLDKAAGKAPSAFAPAKTGLGQKITAERQALINQALAIQRSKAKLLDALGPEAKLKLQLAAKKMMNPGKLHQNK